MIDKRSKYLRKLILRMVAVNNRGHIGPALSIVEICRVIFDSYLRYRPELPNWSERDIFILSKGHGCLALYAILADKKFFPMQELDNFCKPKSILGGHPEFKKIPGVEASTGALGHGLSIGVGMASVIKIKNQNRTVNILTGDGEINEGSIWEAAMSAAKHKLYNLNLFIDYNKLQSYGKTSEVLELEPMVDKWKSFGFSVQEVNGHDIQAMENLLKTLPLTKEKPNAIICHTVKGKGIKFAENNPEWHHKSNLSNKDLDDLYNSLN